jgi:hypothetical protein
MRASLWVSCETDIYIYIYICAEKHKDTQCMKKARCMTDKGRGRQTILPEVLCSNQTAQIEESHPQIHNIKPTCETIIQDEGLGLGI